MICPFHRSNRSPGMQAQGRTAGAGGKSGESLIESCIIFALLCLIFLGMFQVSQVFAAREILSHAAARGTRAKTVGFNQWMVYKCVRAAAIPNAGRLTEPPFQNDDPALQNMVSSMKPGPLWMSMLPITPHSFQYDIESARVPEYLASVNDPTSEYILNYADWDTVRYLIAAPPAIPGAPPGMNPEIHLVVHQNYPMKIPMHRTFYAADNLPLFGESYIENYYPLYIDDRYW